MGLFNTDTGKLVYIVPQSSYYFAKAGADQDFEEDGSFEGPLQDPDLHVKQQQDARLILSATTQFSKTETATTTNYPVSSSGSQGDHYRTNGPTISFRGVISESSVNLIQGIQGLASDKPNEAFIETYIAKIRETLRMLKDENGSRAFPLVNIHLPDNNSENNCLITSFKISRDNKVGNGYNVDITAKKLLSADTEFTIVPASDVLQVTTQTTANPVTVGENPVQPSLHLPDTATL